MAPLRGADLGQEDVVEEERERLGEADLIGGCIPSRAPISAVELSHAAREASKQGGAHGRRGEREPGQARRSPGREGPEAMGRE